MVFHGRRDLGTIQTYVAHGGRGAGSAVAADELLRVPCDLDLAGAEDRDEAEHLYAEQATAMRDALEAADTVLDIWREPLEDLAQAPRRASTAGSGSTSGSPRTGCCPLRSSRRSKGIVVTAVCSPRPLAEGQPPMGIACAQQDVARVYPLPDDPERCLEDFLEHAAEHARRVGEQLGRQEQSVRALPRALRRGVRRDRLTCAGGDAPPPPAPPSSSSSASCSSSSSGCRSCSRAG